MSKHWKVKAGLLLLSVFVLLSVFSVLPGTVQPQGRHSVGDMKNSSFESVLKGFQADDNYEPNDDRTSAYDLSNEERTWLSTIDGYGLQWDDDWFRIYVSTGNSHLNVELTFTHSLGDIDIAVVSSTGSSIASSTGVQNNEHISVDVTPGTYYLRIYYDDDGNPYDLWWDDSTSGSTPPTGPPPLPPFVFFIIAMVVVGIVITIVVVVCIVVIVRKSTTRRTIIRHQVSTRSTTTRPTTTRPSKTVEPAAPTRSGPTRKCPNCGSILEPADKFCVGCGKAVSS